MGVMLKFQNDTVQFTAMRGCSELYEKHLSPEEMLTFFKKAGFRTQSCSWKTLVVPLKESLANHTLTFKLAPNGTDCVLSVSFRMKAGDTVVANISSTITLKRNNDFVIDSDFRDKRVAEMIETIHQGTLFHGTADERKKRKKAEAELARIR